MTAIVTVTSATVETTVLIENAEPIADFTSKGNFVPTQAVIRTVGGRWISTTATGPRVLKSGELSETDTGYKDIAASEAAPSWAKPPVVVAGALTKEQIREFRTLIGSMPYGGGLGSLSQTVTTIEGVTAYLDDLRDRLHGIAKTNTEITAERDRLKALFAGGAAFLAALQNGGK